MGDRPLFRAFGRTDNRVLYRADVSPASHGSYKSARLPLGLKTALKISEDPTTRFRGGAC
jgi:hypothetical protein